jgi:hypothetical protein
MTVTNGFDKLYSVTLDEEYLESHRKKTGIEGTWHSFFTLMKQAIDHKNLNLVHT